MKEQYPVYKSNHEEPETEKIFQSLSKKNKEAIEKFMAECSIQSKSIKRTENRKRALIRFFDFLEKDYDKIAYDDYVKVASAISNSKLGTYTRNGDRDFIKRFLRDNYNDWQIKFKGFKLLRAESKSEEQKLTPNDILTDLEIERLIRTSENMKHKALISVLAESAARPEEILKLRWSDVDFNSKIIYLFSIKTKKKRAVPINESISHLRRLRKEMDYSDNDLIFYSAGTRKDKPMASANLNLILKTLSQKAKINKNVYPYIFRHSRLSVLIRKLSPKVYEMISGHSLEMGMKTYSHLSQDVIISEMKEKVFQAEELSPELKNELQQQIKKQQEGLDKLTQMYHIEKQTSILLSKKILNQISETEFKKELGKLATQKYGDEKNVYEII